MATPLTRLTTRTPRKVRGPLLPHAPPAIEIELVRMLYADRKAMVGLAVVLVAVMIVAALDGDAVAVGLAGAVLAITLARLAIVAAFRRADTATLDLAEARFWERRFAWGSYAAAVGIGVANLHALQLNDSIIALLIVALTFAYVFSLVLRLSVRPRICAISVALVVGVTALGGPAPLMRDTHLTPSLAFAAFVLIGAILVGMAFEMTRYTYCLIVEQLMARRDLSRMARQDPLTGLPNRISLRERFEAALADLPPGASLAVHYLDLDRFKAVNDTYGHRTGDALLRQAANRMAMNLPAGDTVARLAGDEFAIVQSGIDGGDAAEDLARRVIAAVGDPYAIKGERLRIGVTVGIALVPGDAADLDTALERADAALYRAKAEGRGGFARWSGAPEPVPIRA